MNQSILFNDDHVFIKDKGVWQFSGLLGGDLITIYIAFENNSIDQQQKFIWEELVEDFLEEGEPNSNNEIWL